MSRFVQRWRELQREAKPERGILAGRVSFPGSAWAEFEDQGQEQAGRASQEQQCKGLGLGG